MGILNRETLTDHGNVAGRKAIVEILEAGLEAADPYYNTKKLMRIDGGRLIVGHPVPDIGCVIGSQKIVDMARGLRQNELVFTIACNGVSSLLTLPVPGITIDDAAEASVGRASCPTHSRSRRPQWPPYVHGSGIVPDGQ